MKRTYFLTRDELDAIIKAQILDVADTLAVLQFTMNLNGDTRTLTIHAKISTTFGVVQVEGNFP